MKKETIELSVECVKWLLRGLWDTSKLVGHTEAAEEARQALAAYEASKNRDALGLPWILSEDGECVTDNNSLRINCPARFTPVRHEVNRLIAAAPEAFELLAKVRKAAIPSPEEHEEIKVLLEKAGWTK